MKFLSSDPQRLLTTHLLSHDEAAGFVGVGIGKTSATLDAINQLFKQQRTNGVLVMAPMRVANLTWPMEVNKWDDFKWMKVANLRHEAGKRAFMLGKAHVYVCNYEALMTRVITLKKERPPTEAESRVLRSGRLPDQCWIRTPAKRKEQAEGKLTFSPRDQHLMSLGQCPPWVFCYDERKKSSPGLIDSLFRKAKVLPFDTIVVDESTKIKSNTHKGANQMRVFNTAFPPKRVWALTGTPAPNSLLDLFAQIRFIDGGKRLGVSYEHFKQTYFKQSGYGGYKWAELPDSKEQIEQRIAPITLTLRSSEWLDIPETLVEDIEIPLGAEMAKEYRDFEKQLIMEVKGKEITAANAAALVSKLLQFTSGAIYDSEKEWHRIHDLKLKALEKLVKGKGPVLVACSFRHEQARIRQAFPQAKFFDDAKSAGAQMELLDAWNAGKVPMLVAHPKSVGHGLNLQHGGNVIVWFTLTYSREDYEQMIARLARRGQEDITYVYRLMCPDTVDYAVATVIEEKRATEDRLLTALQLLESYREGAAKPVKIKPEPVEEDWI